MIVLKPTDKLNFGKNKGYLLSEIFKYQPSYIEWAIINIESFKIDIAEFEKLSNPTPVNYMPNNFNEKENNKDWEKMSLLEKLGSVDSTNQVLSISELIKAVEDKILFTKEINYIFPAHIIKMNELK
jgi:hypothetical protein